MEVTSILFSRIAWSGKFVMPPGGLWMPHFVSTMREFSNFVEFPNKLEDFDPGRGITFKHGIFSSGETQSKELVIGEFTLFSNGLIVLSQAPTEDMEVFLRILFGFLEKHPYGKFEMQADGGKTYTSNLEIILKKPLPATNIEKTLAASVSRRLSPLSSAKPKFEKTSFAVGFESIGGNALLPPRFLIARRDGLPYSSNTYFSEAPLPTSDHISLLEEFEAALPN